MLKHYDERAEFPDETDTCAMAQPVTHPVAHNLLSHSDLQKPPAADGEQEVRISGWLAGSCAPRKAAPCRTAPRRAAATGATATGATARPSSRGSGQGRCLWRARSEGAGRCSGRPGRRRRRTSHRPCTARGGRRCGRGRSGSGRCGGGPPTGARGRARQGGNPE